MLNNQKIKRIYSSDLKGLNHVEDLLSKQGLKFERTITEVYGLYDNNEMIGTGSIFGNVLKMIAIDPEHQGSNLINRLMSHLINRANNMGQNHLFIYTSPSKYKSFEHFGFYKVASTEEVVLMENRENGLENYLEQLTNKISDRQESAGIVVNCNPFTLGHRYLIERAAKENNKVHVFVLWENLSTFPSEIRFKLVKEGIQDLDNVEVHWAKDYMISSATFPSYFIEDHEKVVSAQTKLDVKIFGHYIAKALNITKRYIGEEPLNPVTNKYNDSIKALLPLYGIEVLELPRIENNQQVISASSVRSYIAEDKWELLKKIVPNTTLNYLKSEEAIKVIEKIKKNYKPEKLV